MKKYEISPIGFIRRSNDQTTIEILPEYSPALKELETFSHIQIIWWFSEFDDPTSRKTTQFDKMPFEGPALGVFACRSPMRPNPLGLSTAKILGIQHTEGMIKIADIDAFEGTPVLDIKAYMPSCDRVKEVIVPDWMSDWPEWLPENGLGLED